MNTNHTTKEELIGEVVSEKGNIAVHDLFSDDKIYLLEQHLNKTSPSIGCIVRGQIRNGYLHTLTLLATPQSIKATLYLIAGKHKLDPLFSTAIMQEVEEILENPGLDDPALIDLENLAFCTIDDADTRDLDQALYIDKDKTKYKVYYALADAAYYVRPSTQLFDEALKRGSSYYLPGLMIPMLPRSLSEGLISLNENMVRRAMVFELHLDSSGVCIDTRLYRARIKSRAKLSFEKVQAFLDYPEQNLFDDLALGQSLRLLKEVGELRLRLAEERNIVRYRRHEVKVKLGNDGFRFNILDDLRNDVEGYNEQLSLLCNVEGARFLKKEDTDDDHIHPVYRVHPHPPQTQISAFERLLQALIKIHKLDSELWSWQQNGQKTLADYLKALPVTGFQSRIAQAIHRQAVMINVRSSFSEEAAMHYGVGADVYARFSAPMREIVGIFLHKEAAEIISDTFPALSKTEDEALREQIIKIANRSKTIQRKISQEGNLLVLNQMFQDDMQYASEERPSHQGTVIGIDKRKVYVLLDNPKIEVKMYISHLETDLKTNLSTNDEKVILFRPDLDEVIVRLGDSVSIYVKEQEQVRERWVILFEPKNTDR